jgi:hypothetical protein
LTRLENDGLFLCFSDEPPQNIKARDAIFFTGDEAAPWI